ncbi:DNA methyltransferase [Mesorhizobium ciceri]|nr:DNA methylase [Mesorhizobium ciceri biovar biserrulae]
MNKLFFGDNLDMLRENIDDQSVDLVYLDPPFNSRVNYNQLFKEPTGAPSEAQVQIFQDTWGWGQSAESAFDDVMRQGGDVSVLLRAMRSALGQNSMMAYLAMMAVRLIELHRVLKPTGSLYLHCDPTASHYLKLLLDNVFGGENFLNEIVWKRTSAHSAARRWADLHDTILYYSKGPEYTWNRIVTPYDASYVARFKNVDSNGRRWSDDNLTAPGTRRGFSGSEWHGFNPTEKGNHWKISNSAIEAIAGEEAVATLNTLEKLDLLHSNGMIYWPLGGGFPRFKRVLGDGLPLQDLILDIPPLNSQASERLGYPTQKPSALLSRLVRASSNQGQVVLDPFCGCGTTIEAAETLGRQWIGIDVAHYAVSLIEARLNANHPRATYSIDGRPTTIDGAHELARRDKHQFQMWAAWRLGAQSYRETKKGPDRGIDGRIQYKNGIYGWGQIIISVKGGDHVGVSAVRDLRGVIEREKAEMGVMVTLAEPTRQMVNEAVSAGFVSQSAHGRKPRLQIVTAEEIINGQMPDFPPLPEPMPIRQRAKKHKKSDQIEMLLPIGEGIPVKLRKNEVLDPRYLDLVG